ncbi:MAG: hypothetical protein R3F23_03275 [Verrucomicrobiia bacterium]
MFFKQTLSQHKIIDFEGLLIIKCRSHGQKDLGSIFETLYHKNDDPKPTLKILNAKGQPVHQLNIANIIEVVEPNKDIGVRRFFDNGSYEDAIDLDGDLKFNEPKEDEFKREYVDGPKTLLEEPIKASLIPGSSPTDKRMIVASSILTAPLTLFPEKSPDKFIIQYSDPSLKKKGQIEVNVEIYNPNSHDKLESLKLTLHEKLGSNGVYEGESIILVANKIADELTLNGMKDNETNDQTLLAEVGSEIKVSYQKSENEKIEATAGVPLKGIGTVQPVILKDENEKPVAAVEDSNRHIQEMNEIVAPEGLHFNAKDPIYVDTKKLEVNLKDGLSPEELKIIYDSLTKDQKESAFVIAGNNLDVRDKNNKPVDGFTLTNGITSVATHCPVVKTNASYGTLAHEFLLHQKLNVKWAPEKYLEGHYKNSNSDARLNLFSDGGAGEEFKLDGLNYLNRNQLNLISQLSIFRNPKPEELPKFTNPLSNQENTQEKENNSEEEKNKKGVKIR